MGSFKQLTRGLLRDKKLIKDQTKALKGCPQKKGFCTKILILKPKKPNSAERKIAKVKLSTKRIVFVGIPGQGHNLQQYSNVLVRGGRVNDVPGVRYKMIKGKYDFVWAENFKRQRRRSKFGAPLERNKT